MSASATEVEPLVLQGEVKILLIGNETEKPASEFISRPGTIPRAGVKVVVFQYSDGNKWLFAIAKPFGNLTGGLGQTFSASLNNVKSVHHGKNASEEIPLSELPVIERATSLGQDLAPIF